jgi:hypothetical protein
MPFAAGINHRHHPDENFSNWGTLIDMTVVLAD